jgi:hypothetical protein
MKKSTLLFILFIFLAVQLTKAQAPSDTIGAGRDLQFDGYNGNYVDLGANTYNTLEFPFTVEAWINPIEKQPGYNACVFSTDNNANVYGGVWIELSAGAPETLIVDFGNGQGFGYQYRRGFTTTNPVSLNQWTHLAVVCNSATDVAIYFNGVLQSASANDGTSTAATLIHLAGGHSNIGRRSYDGNEADYIGQIDEVRLWNIALSQTAIQQTMCSKINPNTSGLIGYWKADEADTTSTVKDYSSSGINGTIVDTVIRGISNAPLGNSSTNLYTPDFGGVSLQVGAASGDSLLVDQISGTPDGVQVYAVNSSPYDITGLKSNPGSYFGVFSINGASSTYSVAYKYSLSDGVVNAANEDSLSLSRRPYTTFVPWLFANGTLNTTQQTITQTDLSSPQEYALNVPTVNSGIQQLTANSGQLSVYPNPSSGAINIASTKTIDAVTVTNLLGQTVLKSPSGDLGVTQFTFELKDEGMYFVTVTSENQVYTSKIIMTK